MKMRKTKRIKESTSVKMNVKMLERSIYKMNVNINSPSISINFFKKIIIQFNIIFKNLY